MAFGTGIVSNISFFDAVFSFILRSILLSRLIQPFFGSAFLRAVGSEKFSAAAARWRAAICSLFYHSLWAVYMIFRRIFCQISPNRVGCRRILCDRKEAAPGDSLLFFKRKPDYLVRLRLYRMRITAICARAAGDLGPSAAAEVPVTAPISTAQRMASFA